MNHPTEQPAATPQVSFWTEDLLAILIGWSILLISLFCVRLTTTTVEQDSVVSIETTNALERIWTDTTTAVHDWVDPIEATDSGQQAILPVENETILIKRETTTTTAHVLAPYIGMPSRWYDNPIDTFRRENKPIPTTDPVEKANTPAAPPVPSFQPELSRLQGSIGSGLIIGVLFTLALLITGGQAGKFLLGYPAIFALGLLSYVLAGQAIISQYNLEYALWALLVGLIISNTIGVPQWLRGAARTEFYIKTGLVLLGSEILMSRLLALGLPGVFVAWVVTPIVLITTFWFGQKVLKIKSPTLNMVISADMSVCGVSAAIAAAAACKAKKEELSLAIGMSLSFTVIMMVAMPAVIRFFGMDEVIGGAWIGGTIDSTGAVAAAGEFLGKQALEVAATIKMIQNILIGVIAFGIAVFWTTYMDRDPDAKVNVGWSEIWLRFPKFILGFIAASIVFSAIAGFLADGALWTSTSISVTKDIRGWLFGLAFVSIGLDTNYSVIKDNLRGGKPVLLYLCGQTLNLTLTLAMAYLMFKVVFPEAAN